jgi:hypothetical protein
MRKSSFLCVLYLLFLLTECVDGEVSFFRNSSRLGNQSALLCIEALSSSTHLNGLEKKLIIMASHFDLIPIIIIYYSLNESKLHVQPSLTKPHLSKSASRIFTIVSIGENTEADSVSKNLERILIPILRPIVLKDKEKVEFSFHQPDSLRPTL